VKCGDNVFRVLQSDIERRVGDDQILRWLDEFDELHHGVKPILQHSTVGFNFIYKQNDAEYCMSVFTL